MDVVMDEFAGRACSKNHVFSNQNFPTVYETLFSQFLHFYNTRDKV